ELAKARHALQATSGEGGKRPPHAPAPSRVAQHEPWATDRPAIKSATVSGVSSLPAEKSRADSRRSATPRTISVSIASGQMQLTLMGTFAISRSPCSEIENPSTACLLAP